MSFAYFFAVFFGFTTSPSASITRSALSSESDRFPASQLLRFGLQTPDCSARAAIVNPRRLISRSAASLTLFPLVPMRRV